VYEKLLKPRQSFRITLYFQKLLKFDDIPSSGSPFVPCGRTYVQTDMNKLIVTFRKFATTTKNDVFPITDIGIIYMKFR